MELLILKPNNKMNKILLNITDKWSLDFINFSESKDIFLIPKSLDDDLEKFILEHPEYKSGPFYRNYYQVISNIIIHKYDLTSICNNVKQILEICNGRFYEYLHKNDYELNYTKTYELIDMYEKELVLIVFNSKKSSNSSIDISLSDTVLNNPNYLSVLNEATINIQDALVANVEYIVALNNKLPVDKRLPDSKLICKIITVFNNLLIFNKRRFGKSGSKVNRQYSSFVKLSSVARQYVKYNGNYFHSFDILAAQPSLYCILLEQNGYKIDEAYRTDCKHIYEKIMDAASINGYDYEELPEIDEKTGKPKFYNTFQKKPSGKYIYKLKTRRYYFDNRDDVKVLVYRSVYFYQKTAKASITSRLFQDLFPITFKSILEFSNVIKKEYKDLPKAKRLTLASFAQNLEATIMFDYLPNCPFFTVHDQIYVIDKIEGLKFCNRITEKYKNYVVIEWKHEPSITITGDQEVQYTESIVNEFVLPSRKKHLKVNLNDFTELYEKYSRTYLDKNRLRSKICYKLGISNSNYYTLIKQMNKEAKPTIGQTTFNNFQVYKCLGYSVKQIMEQLNISERYYFKLNKQYKTMYGKIPILEN